MKISKVLAAAAVLAFSANVAGAQVGGIPFYPTSTGLGAFASADYGNPEGGNWATALTAGGGFGPFGATATVGQLRDGTTETMYGGTLAMKLFGGGLVPLTISAQGGAARWKVAGVTKTSIPVGVVARLNVPLFPLKPFAIGYYRLGTNMEDEVRVSVGANFNFLFGLGFHGAYDRGDSGSTWGVGAHFNFRVPVPVPVP